MEGKKTITKTASRTKSGEGTERSEGTDYKKEESKKVIRRSKFTAEVK